MTPEFTVEFALVGSVLLNVVLMLMLGIRNEELKKAQARRDELRCELNIFIARGRGNAGRNRELVADIKKLVDKIYI